MTTVAELIAKLQTLPQDAEVEVRKEVTSGYYTSAEMAAVDIEYGVDVFDYTGEMWKKSALFGRVFVHIEAK